MASDNARLARTLHAGGKLQQALEAYQLAHPARKGDPVFLHDHAALLMQLGRESEAIPLLRSAIALPAFPAECRLLLALCLRSVGSLPEALEQARLAASGLPRNVTPLLVIATCMLRLHRADAAERALRRCLELFPDSLQAWHYLGEALQAQSRWRDAIDCYRRVLAHFPGEMANIGQCAARLGELELALDCFERMAALHPERVESLAMLALTQAQACDFPGHEATRARILDRFRTGGPLDAGDMPDPFALAVIDLPDDVKITLLRRHAGVISARAPQRVPPEPHGQDRIRIGYISPDFGNHAVGQLLQGLFDAHDRRRFEIIGFGLQRHTGPVSDAIIGSLDKFTDLTMTEDRQAVSLLSAAGLDVLIDLGGFTAGARPELLAARAARRQLGWLGFIHGQEAGWLDGIVLDSHAAVPVDRWPYSDRVVELACPLLPPGRTRTGRGDRARFGFPEDAFVFASFNNGYKLDGALLASWARILSQVESSMLVIYLEPHARAGFMKEWQRHGMEAGRIRFLDKIELDEHQDRAASCDLLLDAFRYNGGATTVAAITAGLPVLSVMGDTPLSRMSASLNMHIGMHELVCSDHDDYVGKAVLYARDRDAYRRLRASLSERLLASGFLDPRRVAAQIESACCSLLDLPRTAIPS